MELVIRNEHLNEILEKAGKSSVEICGFLFGRITDGKAIVEEIRFIPNRLNSPSAFEMDPLEMVRAIDEAEEKGLEVVGIFHSHLCAPVPSLRDLKGMELWPVVWLIAGSDGSCRAFVLEEGKTREIQIRLK